MWSAYNGTPATSWFLLRKVPCASIFTPQHLGDGAAPVSKQGMVSHFAGARGNSILLCFIFPQPCLCHLLAVWPESNDFISVFFSVGNNTSPYLTQDLWRGNVLMYKHLGRNIWEAPVTINTLPWGSNAVCLWTQQWLPGPQRSYNFKTCRRSPGIEFRVADRVFFYKFGQDMVLLWALFSPL